MSRLSRRRSRFDAGEGSVAASSAKALPRVFSDPLALLEDALSADRGFDLGSAAERLQAHRELSDGRFFARRSVARFGRPSRPRGASSWKGLRRLELNAPSRVRFCVARKQRREVLFAWRKVGFRGSSPGPYRRYGSSQWRC